MNLFPSRAAAFASRPAGLIVLLPWLLAVASTAQGARFVRAGDMPRPYGVHPAVVPATGAPPSQLRAASFAPRVVPPESIGGPGARKVSGSMARVAGSPRSSTPVPRPAAAATWWSASPRLAIGPAHLDVRDRGARGDGVHDDTAAIQAAIDALPAAGGTVEVPAGVYMIDALRSVRLRSHVRLQLAPQAQLRAIPNASERSYVVRIWGVTDVQVSGGRIVGERVAHRGTTGEWGHGISVLGASHVVIRDLRVSDCWGDGLYVGATGSGSTLKVSSEVTINHVVSTGNRRQGLSITPAYHVYVLDSIFSDTHGTLPQAGIDIEPMTQGPTQGVRLENNQLIGNQGNGLEVHDNVSDLAVIGNTLSGNRGFGAYLGSPAHGTFQFNSVLLNGLAGISLAHTTHDFVLAGNALVSNSTRYTSPSSRSYDITRDLQVGSGTYGVTLAGNTFSPLR